MNQEYKKINDSIPVEKVLTLKANLTGQIVDKLLESFKYKTNKMLFKAPFNTLDSKAVYLRLLKHNWVDLIESDQNLVLEILVQNSNKIDYSNILKYIPTENDRQLNNQRFKLKSNNKDLEELTEYIYSTFNLALEESFIEFCNSLDTIRNVNIDDNKIIFDNILHRIAIEKFSILNTILEITPKINIWQRAITAFRKFKEI